MSVEKPRVSIIIITYNDAKYIEQAVLSALKQSYESKEIIVVDDGSTDNTRQILDPYMNRIRYHYQENAGIAHARDTGQALSEAEFVNYLDSDDYFIDPDKIKNQVALLDANPTWAIVLSHYDMINNQGEKIYTVYMPTHKPTLTVDDAIIGVSWILMTCLIRRDWIDLVGGFVSSYPRIEDFVVRMKMLALGAKMGVYPSVTFAYRIDSDPSKRQDKDRIGADSLLQLLNDLFEKNYFPDFTQKQKQQVLEHYYHNMAIIVGRSANFEQLERYIQQLQIYCSSPNNCAMLPYHVFASIIFSTSRDQIEIAQPNELINTLHQLMTDNAIGLDMGTWWYEIWWIYYYLDMSQLNDEDDFMNINRQNNHLVLARWLQRPIRDIVKLAQTALIQHMIPPTEASIQIVTYFWQDVMQVINQPESDYHVITLYLTVMTRCIFAKKWRMAMSACVQAIKASKQPKAILPWLRFFRSSLYFATQKI